MFPAYIMSLVSTTKIVLLADFPLWIINEDFPASSGHYGVWLVALFHALSEEKHLEVHWVVVSKRVSKTCLFEREGQFFHVVPRWKKTIGLYTGYLYERRQIARMLKEIQPDFVHSWGTEDVYALAGVDYKGKKLLSLQGVLTACCECAPMPRFVRGQAFWERYALRRCVHFSTESAWARDRILEINPKACVTLVEYGVEKLFFDEIRCISNKPSCFYAGSINLLKGVPDLIEIFSSPELSHIELRLAGDGELINSLKNKSTPNIVWLGRLSRQEIVKELARSWCLIHPSRADTGPTIVKEARVIGLPVIVTEDCGAKQYIIEGKSGFVIPVGDKKTMRDSILYIMSSRENSLLMGAYDQERCRVALRPQLTVQNFLELYASLLK